jgi:hypothetical protein
MSTYYLVGPRERPYWQSLAHELWGPDCDIDSDGNDDEGLPGGWTELTIALRPDGEERVDIDPLDTIEPMILVIRSDDADLAKRAATFLQARTGGELSELPPPRRSNVR